MVRGFDDGVGCLVFFCYFNSLFLRSLSLWWIVFYVYSPSFYGVRLVLFSAVAFFLSLFLYSPSRYSLSFFSNITDAKQESRLICLEGLKGLFLFGARVLV